VTTRERREEKGKKGRGRGGKGTKDDGRQVTKLLAARRRGVHSGLQLGKQNELGFLTNDGPRERLMRAGLAERDA